MDKPYKIRLPDLVRLVRLAGRSNFVTISEGLTEMDLSREVLQFPLNSKEVGAGKSAVYPRLVHASGRRCGVHVYSSYDDLAKGN